MRKLSLFVLLFVTIAVFSMPHTSVAGGNKNSSQHSICDPLKDKGVTKGLFGLCVAYCEAGANSGSVLDNYNDKKTKDDPAMPCLEAKVLTLSCACWSGYTAEQIGISAGFEPASCVIDGTFDTLYYEIRDDGGNLLSCTLTPLACGQAGVSTTTQSLGTA